MKKYYDQPFCEVFWFDSNDDVLTNSETPGDVAGSGGNAAGNTLYYAGKSAYGHKFYAPDDDE